MTDASIALNRFGLGAVPGQQAGADPRKWLIAQFDRYDPRPPAIARAPGSRQVAEAIAAYVEQARLLRLNRTPAAAPVAPPAAAVPPPGEQMAAAAAMSKPAPEPRTPAQEARRAAQKVAQDQYSLMVQARAESAFATDTPFVERLVHFWANHFAVSADEFRLIGLAGTLEFEAIRPHVLGRFGDMLNAVERHPAMLIYLNQAESVGPGSAVATQRGRRGRRLGLNENLAREIMELHTLGVRTVYTQADVTEFARAMTGWTVDGLGRAAGKQSAGGPVGSFAFLEQLHEPGTRTILGRQWDQQGEAQAASVLDMLATHPATARHIATKLARHFAGDDPPPTLVARLEKAFLKSGGDLPTVYRTLIDSPECWVDRPVKFKSPWEWSVSAMRALGNRPQGKGTQGLLAQLGQPVWKPGSPAGWEDVSGSWAGPDAVMRRVEASERMAQRTRDMVDPRARVAELFPGAVTPATTQAIARAESPSQGIALMLASAEFMRR
ncbi:DUF1800 family protein [Sphingomonas sp. CJ20]